MTIIHYFSYGNWCKRDHTAYLSCVRKMNGNLHGVSSEQATTKELQLQNLFLMTGVGGCHSLSPLHVPSLILGGGLHVGKLCKYHLGQVQLVLSHLLHS